MHRHVGREPSSNAGMLHCTSKWTAPSTEKAAAARVLVGPLADLPPACQHLQQQSPIQCSIVTCYSGLLDRPHCCCSERYALESKRDAQQAELQARLQEDLLAQKAALEGHQALQQAQLDKERAVVRGSSRSNAHVLQHAAKTRLL